MPVFRPTANCIWNSFRNSGKRHLILTGGRGCGKTTLMKLLFPVPLPGITTWSEPQNAVWLKDNLSGCRALAGIYDGTLPGTENKMVLCPEGFHTLGIPVIRQCTDCDSEWITIDEIGYLETGCMDYCNAVRRLMDHKHLAAVVRKQDTPFIREIICRDDVFAVDLDVPYGNIGCIIMASGLGKRFGGNKLMADFHGEPLICRVLSATGGIFQHRVVVTRHKDIAAVCQERGIETLLHDLPYRSDTVRLGLEAIGDVEGCMFCPGDQPLLRQETIAALALAAVNDSASIWRPAFEDTPGAPVLFPGWTFSELADLPEGKGGGFIIKKHSQHLRTISVEDRYELMDADSSGELALLAASARE